MLLSGIVEQFTVRSEGLPNTGGTSSLILNLPVTALLFPQESVTIKLTSITQLQALDGISG